MPDSDESAELKRLEEEAYERAKHIRREILADVSDGGGPES